MYCGHIKQNIYTFHVIKTICIIIPRKVNYTNCYNNNNNNNNNNKKIMSDTHNIKWRLGMQKTLSYNTAANVLRFQSVCKMVDL